MAEQRAMSNRHDDAGQASHDDIASCRCLPSADAADAAGLTRIM